MSVFYAAFVRFFEEKPGHFRKKVVMLSDWRKTSMKAMNHHVIVLVTPQAALLRRTHRPARRR